MRRYFLTSALLTVFVLPFLFGFSIVAANSNSSINATVKVSVCGNNIKESGEECDGVSFGDKTCSTLGFDSGSLSCNIACGFETDSCIAHTIDASNIEPNELDSLAASGYLTIPSDQYLTLTSTFSTNEELTLVTVDNSNIILPKDLTVTTSDGSQIDITSDLSISEVATTSVLGVSSDQSVKGVLQWGVSDTTLNFDMPITVSIYVGNLQGQTLQVYRSNNLVNGWTNDGIISPATCTVDSGGNCIFQATKASYYVVAGSVSETSTAGVNSATGTSSAGTTVSSAARSNSTPFPSPSTREFKLPFALQIFDTRGLGKLLAIDIASHVGIWVDSWKGDGARDRCDINRDNDCDAHDFSILMYYINR